MVRSKEETLQREYEETFDGAEKIEHQMQKVLSPLKITPKQIGVDDIVLSNLKKISRKETLTGLDGLVQQWDVISPIHVLALEDEDSYQLLDGLRRLAAAVKNGSKTVPAVVWEFENKAEGKENSHLISLMINRSQKYSTSEQWSLLQLLKQKGTAPSLCEYLLQMDAGDAMKLEDVMTAEGDYDDIREKLLTGGCTIEGAYKKLCNLRKKEDKLAKDDALSMPEGSDEDELAVDGVEKKAGTTEGDETKLTMDEVKELLELAGDVDDVALDGVENKSAEARALNGFDDNADNADNADNDISTNAADSSDSNRTDEALGSVVKYKDGKKPIGPEVRIAVLARDKFTCQCCKQGGKSWLPVLVVHHKIPNACGGPDKEENLITLCQNCHMRLHVYTMRGLQVDKSEIDEREQETLKRIFHFGNIALDAFKKRGIKQKERVSIQEQGTRHLRPGANLKENNAAYEYAKANGGTKDEKN